MRTIYAEYARGGHDAETMYVALTGLVKYDDPDPLLAQARALAKRIHDNSRPDSLVFNSNFMGLGLAVQQLTIGKYIKELYIKDNP